MFKNTFTSTCLILALIPSSLFAQSSCSCALDATVQSYKTKVENAVDNQSCTQCVNLSVYLCAARYCENQAQKAKLQQMIEACRFTINSTPSTACCPELLTAPIEWCTKSCNQNPSPPALNNVPVNNGTNSINQRTAQQIAPLSANDLSTSEDINAITNFAASMFNDGQGASAAMGAFLGNQLKKDSSDFGQLEGMIMDNLIKHLFSSSGINGSSDYNVLGGLLNSSAINLSEDLNSQLYSNALSGLGIEGLAQIDLAGIGQLMDLLAIDRADKKQNEQLKQDLIPLYSNAVQNSSKYIKQIINQPHVGKSELFMQFSPCNYFGYCDYRLYLSIGSSSVYKYNGRGGIEFVGTYDDNLFKQNVNLATKTLYGKKQIVVFADSSQILPEKVDMGKIEMPKGIGMNFLVADQQTIVNPATNDFFKLNSDGTTEKIGEFKSPNGYKRWHYYIDFFSNKYSALLATTTPQKANHEGAIFLFDNFTGSQIKMFNYRNLPFSLSYQFTGGPNDSKISLFKIDASERYLIVSSGEPDTPSFTDIGNPLSIVKGTGTDRLAVVDLLEKEPTRIIGESGTKILDFDISKDYQFLVLLRNTPDLRVEVYHFRTGKLIRSISTFVQPFSVMTGMNNNKRLWYGSVNNSKVSITHDNKFIMLDYCLSGRKDIAANNRLMLISLEDIVVDMIRDGMAKK